MITELVFIDLPKGTTRSQALAMYRQTAESWRVNTDLVGKYCFFDEERSIGGGVYIWPSRAEAERWHGDAYKEKVLSVYGAPPRIQILDALIHVDPRRGLLQEV
jgi:hypothetical protein